ncbi:biotin-dependent carboxyltransferase family protein [Gracilimonas sp.]|uniref:5-oxoprolinase subunit C family protein n=1 Tax=Gracilimonas sp. TaxID=1974203 RepID=UPI002870FB3E|nr:biotin-dependent carboxyltransferase family protein [Gracilimonas sp.]
MTGQLEILEGGLLTTIQDQGRFGYRKYGVPVSGAVDSHSAELANWLAGNYKKAPVIECTLIGPTLKFNSDAVIGISGSGGAVHLNGDERVINETIRVKTDDVLKIGHLEKGCRLYIAIKGEWELESMMGSFSTCLQAIFGGYSGRKLKSGDSICWECEEDDTAKRKTPKKLIPHFSTRQLIRIMPGPEWNWISEDEQFKFLDTDFSILDSSNRMGVRLKSLEKITLQKDNMKSGPVVPGTIQLPPNGNPIILMNDAQSVGGYPRIAKIAEADVWRLGQLWKGNKINFSLIERDKAIQLLKYLNNLKKDLLADQ